MGKDNAVKQQKSNKKKQATPASWGKGKSGNPNGRPKTGESMAEITRRFLEETDPQKNNLERRVALLHEAYSRAFCGGRDAQRWAQMLIDRGYGKPVDPIELSGKSGGPIQISYVKDFEGV